MLLMLQEDAELADRLIELRRYIDGLELEFSELAAAFKQSRMWDSRGANSAVDWLRFECDLTSSAAADRVAVGERASEMPATVWAMRNGDIGFAHVAVMARTAEAVGEAFDEQRLLDVARENSPGRFHYKCLHFRHTIDAEACNRANQMLVEQRALRLNTAQDGCLLISGILDPIGGAAVRASLEPLAQMSGTADHRRREQRLADALVEQCTAGKPATVQVTASVETLMALRGASAGEMEFSTPVPAATIRRLACDSTVVRVLLDSRSMPIDVGRASRVVDGALRKALAVRDKHCQWPGCERPASWCDGHHIVHWADGGATDLDNCVLLCRRHHRMVHEGDWRIVRVDGTVVPVAPTVRFGVARGPDG